MEVSAMKHVGLVFICLWTFGILGARVFNSVTTAGQWLQPSTWVDGDGAIPGENDDVNIWGLISLQASVSCHDLNISGAQAMLMNFNINDPTLTVNGNLTLSNTGRLISDNQDGHYISVNLYGNFSQGGLFKPLHLNIMGSGDRHFYQTPDGGYSLAPYGNVVVASGIDVIWLDTDFSCATSNSGYNSNFQSDADYTLHLASGNDISLTNFNLKHAYVLGQGDNVFLWENTLNGILENSTLEAVDVQSGTSLQIYAGVTMRDVSSHAVICNHSNNDRTLALQGSFTNYGELRKHTSGGNLYVTSTGDLYNYGYFRPSTLTLTGSGDRNMGCGEGYPFSTTGNINIESSVGTIHAVSDLWFGDIYQMSGGEFSLAGTSRQGYHLYLSAVQVSFCTIDGGSGSILQGTNMLASNSSFNGFFLYGDISFLGGCTLSNVVNYGTLQNYSNNNYTVSIYGDFINNGTLRNNPNNYGLYLNMYGGITNQGVWTPNTTNMASGAAQSICFPESFPCRSTYFNDTVSTSALLAVGDIWFVNSSLDLNNATLVLDSAPSGIHITDGNLRELTLQSVLQNVIVMSGAATVAYVNFGSITNAGTLTLDGDQTVAGDMINTGTIQNNSNSNRQLTVNGNFTNSGTVRNHPSGFQCTIVIKGNLANTGIWTCNYTKLSGNAAQTISFPDAWPFAGAYFEDTVSASPVYIQAGENLKFCGTYIDFNGASLQMPSGARSLIIENGSLREVDILSSVENTVNMNSGTVEYVSFTGITNVGTLTYGSNSYIYGDLLNYGTIQNQNNSDRSLTVQGNIVNNGTFRNHPGGYTFTVNCTGNITNLDYWGTHTLNMTGTAAQSISFPSGHSFFGSYFYDLVIASPLVLASDCYFGNCTMDMNNASLDMTQGGTWCLFMNTSTLREAIVTSVPGCRFDMAPGGLITYTSFQSIETSGTVTYANGSVIYGNLINSGTLRNYHNNNYTLDVYGNMVNSGTFTNSPLGWYAYLALRGDLDNSGQIACYIMYLSGSSGQHIHNTGTFSLAYLTSNTSSNPIYIHDNIAFTNTKIDMNYNHVYFVNRQGVTISCSGDYLKKATLHGGSGGKLTGAAGFYLEYINSDAIETDGTIVIYSNVYLGTVINHGTLTNGTNNNYTLNVSQSLDNRGSIANNTAWYMFLYLQGNLINTGSITCNQVLLNGTSDQTISRGGTVNPASFYMQSGIGTAQWYLNGSLSGFSGAQIAIPITSDTMLGTWRPYNTSSGVWGRYIHITAGNDPEIPQGLWIEISGTNTILHWEESDYATSYMIYASDVADSGFSLEEDNVTDPVPGDGFVQYSLPITGEKRFFRVAARN